MEERFDPKKHVIQLKGKDYLQVQWRLVWFRYDHPDWDIDTQMTMYDAESKHAIFRAVVSDADGKHRASATGSECARDFTDFIEKAETKAIGRALAILGYGTQFVGDELDEGDRLADAPVDNGRPSSMPLCECCGKPIRSGKKRNGETWSADDIARYTKARFDKAMCLSCAKEAEKQYADN